MTNGCSCWRRCRTGETYREIAALIGRSRSSIAGRVERDAELRRLAPDRHVRPAPPPRHTPVHKLSKTNRRSWPTKVSPPRGSLPNNPKLEQEPTLSPYRPRPAPDSLNVPMVELKALQCKWPVHEAPDMIGGHAFCGAPVAFAGAPYCQFHQHIATPGRQVAG